ncbi:hypothetical protein [Streptomyces sp. CB03911]|uniref:hypothetical protein n=1 Tax=Streptomyces sp. CB03911 TaxID=1804758 RepID=UPI0009624E7A|nr:hypothetical protein [Streptomyces sp. CB03911]OKI16625.1 hypothetical protein A6A07_11500 [Streptomyces sp. CB03911]
MLIATTWVTVLRGVATDLYGDISDSPTEAGTDAQTHIPASLIEGSRSSRTPGSGTPRVVRYTVCRLPAGTQVTEDDRIRDERTGRIYSISAVTQPAAVGITPELRLDLTLVN